MKNQRIEDNMSQYRIFKFWLGVILVIMLIIFTKGKVINDVVEHFSNPNASKLESKTNQNIQKVNIQQNLSDKISVLSNGALQYGYDNFIKNKYVLDGRKIVFYPMPESCPYSKMFINAVEQAKENPELNQYYTFIQSDMPNSISAIIVSENDLEKEKTMQMAMGLSEQVMTQKEFDDINNFRNKCMIFCVIDFKTGKTFSYSAVGHKEANNLNNTLMQLRSM